jgi:hypothetical protein
VTPSDWPLSTVSLVDCNLWEIFTWTGWCIPEALHDLPNVNAALPWRLEIRTPPDEHYMWYLPVGSDVYDAVFDVLTHIEKTASPISAT